MTENHLTKFALAASYVTILPIGRLIKVSVPKSAPVENTHVETAPVENTSIENIPIENTQLEWRDDLVFAGLAKYLPAVGLLIGFILFILSSLIGGHPQAPEHNILNGAIITVAWLLITGGLHFDGLMDTADGIFSHRDRTRMLEIMQDPRVGNFGVLTGVAVFALKLSAIATLAGISSVKPNMLPVTLILLPAWSRFAEAYVIGKYNYARATGKGKVWHDTMVMPKDLIFAAALPAVLTFFLGIFFSGAAFAIGFFAVVSGAVTGAYLNKQLGGQTGDTYGTAVELSEAAALVAMALIGASYF